MKTEIVHPELGSISIKAPTSTGKSILLHKIAKLLEEEFGASVVSPTLEQELKGNDYTQLAKWQKDMVKDTIWYLEEYNV